MYTTDLTLQLASFGGHIEMLEVDELAELRRKVTEKEIDDRDKAYFTGNSKLIRNVPKPI